MIKIKCFDTVTCKKIEESYKEYGNQEIMFVIPNTKRQSVEELNLIANKFPNVIFSVIGGLDPSKEKFNNDFYQSRTYYTANQLKNIITVYRTIEKKIDLSWTETQKAMFIYKELCNRMQYDEIRVDKRDYARGIGGLLYNTAVCSGFAMIYKEALDRIGIECYYQNRQEAHSWNIAKLDGQYRGIELTWDVYIKDEKGCGFFYFNRNDEDFYANKHHNLSCEPEEKEFKIVQYTDEELKNDYTIISKGWIVKIPIDNKGESVDLVFNDIKCSMCKKKMGEISVKSKNTKEIIQVKNFTRYDGSHFSLVLSNDSTYKLKKFFIIAEIQDGVQIGKIFSEQNLINLPDSYSPTIANGLLSRERVQRKIKDYNGYVGYIGQNDGIYYSEDFEKNFLNVIRMQER